MSKDCLNEGAIQAYIDGEMSPSEFSAATSHVSLCEECARLLAAAEDENSLVFAALDREMDALVPTQRLWAKISESIETEASRVSVWSRLRAAIFAPLLNPALSAAAGVLLVVGIVSVSFLTKDVPEELVSQTGQTAEQQVPITLSSDVQSSTPVSVPQVLSGSSEVQQHVAARNIAPVRVSDLSADDLRRLARGQRAQNAQRPAPQYLNYQYLPGEESYIKTIAELEQNASAQTVSFRASSQVALQRDLAVVDESIKRMREVVRKNPRNQAARQMLYSAYQDKVDLLNSAAQRDELMASIR